MHKSSFPSLPNPRYLPTYLPFSPSPLLLSSYPSHIPSPLNPLLVFSHSPPSSFPNIPPLKPLLHPITPNPPTLLSSTRNPTASPIYLSLIRSSLLKKNTSPLSSLLQPHVHSSIYLLLFSRHPIPSRSPSSLTPTFFSYPIFFLCLSLLPLL